MLCYMSVYVYRLDISIVYTMCTAYLLLYTMYMLVYVYIYVCRWRRAYAGLKKLKRRKAAVIQRFYRRKMAEYYADIRVAARYIYHMRLLCAYVTMLRYMRISL